VHQCKLSSARRSRYSKPTPNNRFAAVWRPRARRSDTSHRECGREEFQLALERAPVDVSYRAPIGTNLIEQYLQPFCQSLEFLSTLRLDSPTVRMLQATRPDKLPTRLVVGPSDTYSGIGASL
jgi:hypothetical protein